MPSILITTSRRTSNRVRTFIRDLHSVIPDSERFNRGSMNLGELTARISQSSAKAAFVVSTRRGNPGILQILNNEGRIEYELLIESGLLRRETNKDNRVRINKLATLLVSETSSEITKQFAQYLASILDVKILEMSSTSETPSGGKNESIISIRQENRRTIWTSYHANDFEEIGPRIRISKIQRVSNE